LVPGDEDANDGDDDRLVVADQESDQRRPARIDRFVALRIEDEADRDFDGLTGLLRWNFDGEIRNPVEVGFVEGGSNGNGNDELEQIIGDDISLKSQT